MYRWNIDVAIRFMTPFSNILRQQTYQLIGFCQINVTQRQTDFQIAYIFDVVVRLVCGRRIAREVEDISNLQWNFIIHHVDLQMIEFTNRRWRCRGSAYSKIDALIGCCIKFLELREFFIAQIQFFRFHRSKRIAATKVSCNLAIVRDAPITFNARNFFCSRCG